MVWRHGQAYSQDLRDRVISAVAAGASIRTVAERFEVSPSYVSKVSSRVRETGNVSAKPQRSHMRPLLEPYHDALRAEVARDNDLTLAELCGWIERKRCERTLHRSRAITAWTCCGGP